MSPSSSCQETSTQQSFGTDMGSVTLADVAMEDIEQRALCCLCTLLLCFGRNMQMTPAELSAVTMHLGEFLQQLKSIERTIKFTCKIEEDCRLPFLYTEITCHPDGSLSTTVYRKKTHTYQYLDFTSHNPLSHKLAVVNTQQSRAKTHCTFVNDKTTEENHIASALRVTNYPETITSKIGCITVPK